MWPQPALETKCTRISICPDPDRGLDGSVGHWFETHRLGLSPIVGYLLAGVLIGPHTPMRYANEEPRHTVHSWSVDAYSVSLCHRERNVSPVTLSAASPAVAVGIRLAHPKSSLIGVPFVNATGRPNGSSICSR